MNIVFKDIHPKHLTKAASFVKEALEGRPFSMGDVASTEFFVMGIPVELELYAYTDSVLTITYKETE
jgi:hypothetical protein